MSLKSEEELKVFLEYLTLANGKRFTQSEFKRYLETETDLFKGKDDGTIMRQVGRKLNALWARSSYNPERTELGDDSRVFKEKNEAGRFVYSWKPKTVSSDEEEIGMVLMSMIMEDYCRFVIPDEIYKAYRRRMSEVLNDTDKKTLELQNKFYISPRGQHLRYSNPKFLSDTVTKIYHAILQEKKLAFDYMKISIEKDVLKEEKNKKLISPMGIRFADPKFYLFGQVDGFDQPLKFIVQNMSNVKIIDQPIKENMTAFRSWIEEDEDKGIGPEGFNNKLFDIKLSVNYSKNLVRDILTFKLSENQKYEVKDGKLILSLKNYLITYEFVDWISARAYNIEVLEPLELRQLIKSRLIETLNLYE